MKFRTLVPGRVVNTIVRKFGRRKVVVWFRFDENGISPDLDPKKLPPDKLAKLKRLFEVVEEEKEEITSSVDELVSKTIQETIDKREIVISDELRKSIEEEDVVVIDENKENVVVTEEAEVVAEYTIAESIVSPVVTEEKEEKEETLIVDPKDMSYRDLQAYAKKNKIEDVRQTREKLLELLEV